MGTLTDKVAFITGAARGMGRAHAVKLASEGADVIAIDVCAEFDSTDYPGSTTEDLATTVKLVEGQGRRIIARQTDVRDPEAVGLAVADGVAEFGRLDIVIANAGIIRVSDTDERATDVPRRRRGQPDRRLEHRGCRHPRVDRRGPRRLDRAGELDAGIKASGTDRAGVQGYAASKRALVALMQVWADQLPSTRSG